MSPQSTIVESGTALLNAINSIIDNGSTNRYLIKIEPGIYDLQTSTLNMKPFVDVEGSGQFTTRIQGSVDGDSSLAGVIKGASYCELRNLTVRNYRSTGQA